uniref:Uncharacterized protein n=1 Tax=Dictyoglomus turgidum TaxID=513050 RepID=A0A7C3WLF5_9BACT
MAFIIKGTEENFRSALSQRNSSITSFSLPKPLKVAGNTDKIKNYALMQKVGFLDTSRTAPLFNDPRYTSSTLAIPTDERSLHGLYRFFSETDPIVGASLKILTELPLSSLRLGICEDSGVQQHYEEMWDRINAYKLITDLVMEYYEIGTVVLFGAYNEIDYMWDQFAILNPDYVKIESTWINENPLVKLIPDEALKRIVQTQSPQFLYKQIPEEVKKYVFLNREIPLDPNNTFILTHAKRPYETKGRSIIKRILKVLMLEDRLNQANFALATRHAVPFTVAHVGDPNLNWLPDESDLEEVRDAIAAFELDPNFTYITHPGFRIEYYGSNGRALPVGPELDRIYRLKFIGLGVHEQLLAGQGGSYGQAYISLEVQRQRFLNLQLKLEYLFHNGIFKPIADMCGFYRVKQVFAGYGGVKKVKYGKEDNFLKEIRKAFSYKEDYNNPDFKEFLLKKTAEYNKNNQRYSKEYVFPKLDFGALNASYDENMKNYVRWMYEEFPELVDSGLIARLAKLDRDDQLKAKINDIKRMKAFYQELQKEGLLDFYLSKNKGKGGGMNFDEVNFGGGDLVGLTGEEPPIPAGTEGPPETAEGTEPPPAPEGIAESMEEPIKRLVFSDDMTLIKENKVLKKKKI